MGLSLKNQPYSDGPALLGGFASQELKSFILNSETILIDLRLLLSSPRFLLPFSCLRPGGPKEISFLTQRIGLFRLITCLSGAGFILFQDCRPQSQFRGQQTILRLTAGKEEAIYVPDGFAQGYIFESSNCLYLEFSSLSKSEHKFAINPFDTEIIFATSIGVGKNDLRLINQ